MFTFPRVAHQIVNTRSTVCEARNIMPLTFAFDRHADLICDCGPEVGGRVLHHLDLHLIPSIPYDAFCEGCKQVFFLQKPEQHRMVCLDSGNTSSVTKNDVGVQCDARQGVEDGCHENVCSSVSEALYEDANSCVNVSGSEAISVAPDVLPFLELVLKWVVVIIAVCYRIGAIFMIKYMLMKGVKQINRELPLSLIQTIFLSQVVFLCRVM